MTEPAQKQNNKSTNRTKSPYVNTNINIITTTTNNKNIYEKNSHLSAISPDKINFKNQITTSTLKPKNNSSTNSNIISTTNQITSNITDKLKTGLLDKRDSVTNKIEEFKKSIKTKGYSKSIDTNNPLNTLTNIPATTKVADIQKKQITSNVKVPFGKYYR